MEKLWYVFHLFILLAQNLRHNSWLFFQEARRSIRFYQNIDVKDVRLIDAEIERLMRQIGSVESSKKMIKWSELRKNPGKKAMIIGIVLGVLNHFSGNYALISYTATIFEASESIISPNESALIVSFIQCISAFLVPLFVERCGRKVHQLKF